MKYFKQHFKKALGAIDKLTNKYPILNYYLFRRPYNFYYRFLDERKGEKGENISDSHEKSIVLFTTHKCASIFTFKLIREAVKDKNLLHIDFDSYFSETFPKRYKKFDDKKFLKSAFFSRGYFYGPFRSFRKIPELENYKKVLILRDPRDILTSQYFSFAFSHALINPEMIKNRKEIQNIDINLYVLTAAEELKSIYKDYYDFYKNNDDILFLKYEDMISDFNQWLKQLFQHFDAPIADAKFKKIVQDTSFSVKKENKNAHIRNVKSGDYIDKLNNETIDKLNKIFKEELIGFNYT